MLDDPILLTLVAVSLIAIPVFSYLLGKIKPVLVFILPALALVISFPAFLLCIIVQEAPFLKTLLYASFSLWTGGFFGIFISIVLYQRRKKGS